jgi:hypothetical protein
MSATIEIDGLTFKLEKVEDLSGELAVLVSESYLIYATPYYEGIPVLVDVRDCNNKEIELDGYPVEIDDFSRYSKVVQTLAAKISRRH